MINQYALVLKTGVVTPEGKGPFIFRGGVAGEGWLFTGTLYDADSFVLCQVSGQGRHNGSNRNYDLRLPFLNRGTYITF